MNQNNNFDPVTGTPIQNIEPNLNNKKKANGALLLIIGIVIIGLVISAVCYFSYSKNNKKVEDPVEEKPAVSDTKEEEEKIDLTMFDFQEEITQEYDKENTFIMAIEDVFTYTDRGTVVIGKVERGTIKVNDPIQIIGLNREVINTTVQGIEAYRTEKESATEGESVGIILGGSVPQEAVERGQVLSTPNTIQALTKFEADVYFLAISEGGSRTPISVPGTTDFYFRTTDVEGSFISTSGISEIQPGSDSTMRVVLKKNIALEVGQQFSIRNGGRTLASGTITKVFK